MTWIRRAKQRPVPNVSETIRQLIERGRRKPTGRGASAVVYQP
jgi:hypothetical protein